MMEPRDEPVRILRITMIGSRARLQGRICAWPSGQTLLLDIPGHAPIPLRAAHAPIGGFDLDVPLDLARMRLSDVRVRIEGGDSHALASPVAIEADDLEADELNFAHIAASLSETGRSLPRPASMLERFESLGDNCEFGVFLRHFDALNPSLFRLGATSEYYVGPRAPASGLSAAIANYFDGLAEGDDLEMNWRFGEWMATSRSSGFMFHTGERNPDNDPRSIVAQQSRRLRLAIRVFIERAADPATIFVRKSNGHENEAELRAHLASLRTHGPARLLWVDLASADAPASRVSLLGDGLIRAQLPTMQPYDDAERPDRSAWLACMRQTWMLVEGIAALQDPVGI